MNTPSIDIKSASEGDSLESVTPSGACSKQKVSSDNETPATSIDQSPAPNHSASDLIHNSQTLLKKASQVVAANARQEKCKVQHEDLTLAELQCIEALFKAHLYLNKKRPKRPTRSFSLKDEMERREALIAIRTAQIVANDMLIASMRKINRSVTCSWCQGDGCRSCGQTGKEVADGFRIGMLLNKNWKLQREQELIAQHGTPNNKPMPFGQWKVGMWYTRSTSKHDENMSFLAEAQNG